jgi:hypothetical protein
MKPKRGTSELPWKQPTKRADLLEHDHVEVIWKKKNFQ